MSADAQQQDVPWYAAHPHGDYERRDGVPRGVLLLVRSLAEDAARDGEAPVWAAFAAYLYGQFRGSAGFRATLFDDYGLVWPMWAAYRAGWQAGLIDATGQAPAEPSGAAGGVTVSPTAPPSAAASTPPAAPAGAEGATPAGAGLSGEVA